MMKTGRVVALAVVGLLGIGTLIFHQEVSDFIHSMQPYSAEATLSFGKGLDPSGRFVVDPTTTFSLGENVAWVLQFKKNAGTKELIVALYEVTSDGREIPLDRNKMTVEPTDTGLYNFSTTQAFWALSPKEISADHHTFRIKYLKKRVIAQGDFTIVANRHDQPFPAPPVKTP
jgi:hypothetical protein